jgi:hypothetical protein
MKHRVKTIDDRPFDDREQLLVDQVAAALAEYHGAQLGETHRRMAAALLSKFLRGNQPNIDSLVG